MNGFFNFSEVGKNEFPLKELSKDLPSRQLSFSRLDSSLAKEVPSRMEAPCNIDGIQRSAIKEGLNLIANGEGLTNAQKGNLTEMMMDQHYKNEGYTPIHSPRVASLNDSGHHGIDGVYKRGNEYVIADAKCDSARLKDTQDGRQMSWDWIDKRLDAAVGWQEADRIRDAYEDGHPPVSTEVYHYNTTPDSSGNTYGKIYSVDSEGNKVGCASIVDSF